MACIKILTFSTPAATNNILFGDHDDDADVDGLDLLIFIDVLVGSETSPTLMERADLNCDAEVDTRDVPLFVDSILEKL